MGIFPPQRIGQNAVQQPSLYADRLHGKQEMAWKNPGDWCIHLRRTPGELSVDAAERYIRQIRFPEIGAEGQAAIGRATAVVVGLGALGSVIADLLARAGVGTLRLVDRDVVEWSNLQRQTLYTEADAAAGTPKAVAAAAALKGVNGSIRIEPHLIHLDHSSIETVLRHAAVLIDGTDNFETRYLINDACVKAGAPWVNGGCVGAHGMARVILPGETPCLRCLHEDPPLPGENQSCETAGVLGPAAAMVASFEAMESLKICAGRRDAVVRDLVRIDAWRGETRRTDVSGCRRIDCPCCGRLEFDFLSGKRASGAAALCGRGAVQMLPAGATRIDLAALAKKLAGLGDLKVSEYFVRFAADGLEITVFTDGRAIIKGTENVNAARSAYAKYVGV
jgi:molybdopterin-synthase adenylyltransferase